MTELLSIDEIVRLDEACKKRGQFIGRFVSNGFTDRTCIYIVVDETKTKYALRFVWGDTVNPYWGNQIKLYKNEVESSIKGRDRIETIFPRRNYHA